MRRLTRPAASAALRALAAVALAVALYRAGVAAYFTSEVVAVPPNVEPTGAPRLTKRVLLVVIDALRYDTALTSGAMPKLERRAGSGASGVAITAPVTMTTVGVRAIGTGVAPSLADLVNDIRMPPVEHDNVFAKVRERGGRVALAGERDAWAPQFGHYVDVDATGRDAELTAASLRDTVYGADAIHVRRATALLGRGDWELMVVMLGGLDHASHLYTPFGPKFLAKARAIDGDIDGLVDAAGSETTVLVTSDHGAGDRGHHGSGEPEARRTPLVLLGPGVRAGVRLEARQVDIAPTIAALLGLPFAAPSEGRVLDEALLLDGEARAALVGANVRQLERYARAVAERRGVDAPRIVAEHREELGDWLEDGRARASALPLGWAVALALLAFALVCAPGGGRTGRSSLGGWAIALGAAAIGATLGPRSPWPMGIAVVASAVAVVAGGVERDAGPRRRAAMLAGVLIAVEVAIGVWRVERRAVEMVVSSWMHRLRISGGVALAAVTAAVAAPIALALRRRRSALRSSEAFLVLAILAAAGDALALPAGIAAGAVAAVAVAPVGELIPFGAALAVGGLAILAGDHVGAVATLGVGAPVALGLLGVTAMTRAKRSTIAVLGALGLGGVALRLLGDPPLAFRGFLIAGSIATWVAGRREEGASRWETLGWGGALVLAALCRPAQVPGLVAFTLAASFAGRIGAVAEAGVGSELVAALLAVSLRLGFFAVFEGEFVFSRLEIALGFVGNPEVDYAVGAAAILLKFALPMAIVLALITARVRDEARVAIVGLVGAFWLLRVGHVIASMTIARGTFYSPYADAGHLLFMLLMAGSTALVAPVMVGLGPDRAPETRR